MSVWNIVRRTPLRAGRSRWEAFPLRRCWQRGCGRQRTIFCPTKSGYHVTRWFVFADGTARIGADGPLLRFDASVALAERGAPITSIPAEATVSFEGLGEAALHGGSWDGVAIAELIKELHDKIAILNGAPGAVQTCRDDYTAYLHDPTAAKREQLRYSYEAVPEHLRMYCGTMDSKDWPIRRRLYGDDDTDEDENDGE